LYGLAQDISDLIEIGNRQEIFIIEDAAQSFGASINENSVGTFGDAGFFSLGRGKCLPTGHGGLIVAQEALKHRIENNFQKYLKPITSYDIGSLIFYTAYGAAILPLFWWFIVRSIFNPADDGMEFEELPEIAIQEFSKTQAGIGSSILDRYKEINLTRRQNALRMISQIQELSTVRLPEIQLNTNPVFLRLPIICNSKYFANQVYEVLNQCGIGVSKSYTRTIPDIMSNYLEITRTKYPGASHLANCLLTLPTHQYVRKYDFEKIKEALASSD
jgi:dTDP-4-amino-4,6-dideoxygalactose transaminase